VKIARRSLCLHIGDEKYHQTNRVLIAGQFKIISHTRNSSVADIGTILVSVSYEFADIAREEKKR